MGRKDRTVKINGQRVELAEVEAAARRSAEVHHAAVLAAETQGRMALRESLPGFMQPARIELLDALPLLPGGMLDARALLSR